MTAFGFGSGFDAGMRIIAGRFEREFGGQLPPAPPRHRPELIAPTRNGKSYLYATMAEDTRERAGMAHPPEPRRVIRAEAIGCTVIGDARLELEAGSDDD